MNKVYVDVVAEFRKDGQLVPIFFTWEDGRKYSIDRILKIERCASRKAGGVGMMYTCMIQGQERKLSILIVILINSEIIYLDEPTSGVDPLSRVEIRKIIQKLKEEGKTILITSHDLSEIEKSADYVTMIENGKVVFNEDIDNIKGTTLEELFIKEGGDYE